MAAAGFHQLGSDFANQRIALCAKLARGETVYLAGLARPARIIRASRWSK